MDSAATPGPCRPAKTAFSSLPLLPKNKHSLCQRATGACNEKQVSPRALSALAARQLGVTASAAGQGWAGLTPSVQLPGPRIGCSSHFMPLSRETVTDRPALSQAREARALCFRLASPGRTSGHGQGPGPCSCPPVSNLSIPPGSEKAWLWL